MEAERARKRELDRQRKARARAAEREKKALSEGAALNSDVGRDPRDADLGRNSAPPVVQGVPLDEKTHFRLKNPLGNLEEVRLFSQKEADEVLERLVTVYLKGSEILDDVLEIIVKGHEPVRIWALADDEAEMLASMQLERAKKDKAAARVVRTLLKMYERIYLFLIVGPRLKATASFVKEQGGLSFK